MRDAKALTQPLVTRPAYGQGQASSYVSEAKLPGGGPSDKGLPLDSGIPGTSTFNKDEDDIRDFDQSTDTSPHRVDNADGLLKNRDRVDVNEDNADKHDGIGYNGEGAYDGTGKTKYPYRDGLPHHHNASAEFVAGLWRLRQAHILRVVPESTKVASTPEEILTGLNPKFESRARTCSSSLKRADVKNLRWIFSVDCGNGAKVVSMKAARKGTVTRLSKMEIDLACSCPAWQWLGPEHHAKREEYLDREPRGTASVPVIKDPRGINRVCKHVAAVLSLSKKWEVPAAGRKKKE